MSRGIVNKGFQALFLKRLEADIRDERDSRHGLLKIFLIIPFQVISHLANDYWLFTVPVSPRIWYENSHVSLKEFNIEVIYQTV